jgi:hypothetical protein
MTPILQAQKNHILGWWHFKWLDTGVFLKIENLRFRPVCFGQLLLVERQEQYVKQHPKEFKLFTLHIETDILADILTLN